ncbi:hypothetical protein EYF80_005386 [Liparis tanakae]|uniref:Uncharacterized protein n=1 Tax=Liparis tanakae TaxID=230148 RepID=A0A4Z2J4I4_9TELE|nr:hypothetical protein EYF80_005386 [Liparis tanakae]
MSDHIRIHQQCASSPTEPLMGLTDTPRHADYEKPSNRSQFGCRRGPTLFGKTKALWVGTQNTAVTSLSAVHSDGAETPGSAVHSLHHGEPPRGRQADTEKKTRPTASIIS